jgi:hypothetical protein
MLGVEMNLVKLHEGVFVDPSEVASIQAEVVSQYNSPSISDNSMCETFNGLIVTLKNGRKIAIDKVSPNELMTILSGVTK